ncbi:cyclic nucleotide-binding domain-containing protein [Gaiella sp.]|uniref:cyclic nucleotide-binding domain-containing protein n=1 Tax=Gaiella sp. TaxID=2663207 RepID=UPI003263A9B1
MVDNADLLGQVSLFDGLTRGDLEALGSRMRETHFAAGDVVVREGTTGARLLAFFVILDGTATVTLEGEPRSTLSVGDYFGEIGLLLDAPRMATVVADTDVRCSAMSAWDFRGFVDEYPAVHATLARTLEARLQA